MSLPPSNMTTLETYKILSSNENPYTLNDFRVMEDIVQEAEDSERAHQGTKINSGEMSFYYSSCGILSQQLSFQIFLK